MPPIIVQEVVALVELRALFDYLNHIYWSLPLAPCWVFRFSIAMMISWRSSVLNSSSPRRAVWLRCLSGLRLVSQCFDLGALYRCFVHHG